ncbi:hypothetical protein [Methylomonas koyamae]|uniref:hypothetical protein n=1 Tax=Methylomonas koyamae TaxID=702114 RepID=UPI00112E2B85|nr:hypothetical protein [Methylomonas koyamae]TPQ29030.1 hypothetical protein C2U68_03490 [Methylomonas koyamae]
MKEIIPDYIIETRNSWYRNCINIQSGFIILGIVSILASLVVSTFEPELGSFWTRAVAFVAAATSGVLSSFNMVQKNKDVWTAWRMLTVAILRYERQPEFTMQQLIDVYEQAEAINGNPSLVTTPPENRADIDAP